MHARSLMPPPPARVPAHRCRWDAVDGGTTATVCLVRRGHWMIVAAVGDSSAVLMASDAAAAGSSGGSAGSGGGGNGGGNGGNGGGNDGHSLSELLVAEHSPTNAREYMRMCAFEAAYGIPGALAFVYDCPDFTQVAVS